METSKQQQPEIEARMIARFSDLPEIQADINKYKQTQDGLREMADSVKRHIDSLKTELKALADKAVENRNAVWKKIDEQLLAKELNTVWSFNRTRIADERQAYENACASLGLEPYEGEHLLELIGITVSFQPSGYQHSLPSQT